MKTSFEMEAPFVWSDNYVPLSGYSKVTAAIGRMLGGLTIDGARFRFDSSDFSLAVAQLVLIEAGVDLFVIGASGSNDLQSSFIAMTDGSVWRFTASCEGGKLKTSAYKADEDEVSMDCQHASAMHEAIKRAAISMLSDQGFVNEGDTFQGHVAADPHSAILERPLGYGALIIMGSNGIDKTGWKFSVDAPRKVTLEAAKGIMNLVQMTPDEIAETKKKHAMAVVQSGSGPFPTVVGQA